MDVCRAEVVHTSILAPPHDVAAFLGDLATWPSWAPWIRSVSRTAERAWTLETDAGRMQVQLVEPNALGVLDHHVTLDSGRTVFNSMRVIPNGGGSELVMTIFQQPGVSAAEFERDVRAVRDDLVRLKRAAEGFRRGT
jgi:hypothetical protein